MPSRAIADGRPDAAGDGYDAIIVGAGPAGASAAFHLARRDRRVLMIDAHRFPRDKSCGDGLTPPAVRMLGEMGVLPLLSASHDVRGVRVFMRGHGTRDFHYAHRSDLDGHGLVVPRHVLDEAICRRAVAAGADLWEQARVTAPVLDTDRVVGVLVRRGGRTLEVRAPVVVAADGAHSRLARAIGLLPTPAVPLGFAIRGYLPDIADLDDMLEIFLPLTDPSDRYVLPSYGWVFPTGSDSANVGVGLFRKSENGNLGRLLDGFLARLSAERPSFRSRLPGGKWTAAPLRFDFSPERCVGPGVVLVGDAAGLVSPFTGEGISYALESGKLAADVIDRNLRAARRTPDLYDYALLLEHSYSGYFETGRHSARRYQLVWHVLESTFDSERPPYVLCRRAVLLPEGAGEPHLSRLVDDVAPLIAPGTNVRDDLLAVGEVMTGAVRKEWPFLARLAVSGQGDPGIPFRPALLLLLASYLGDPDRDALIQVGTALELGYVAALAQLGVENDRVDMGKSNWGNKFSILVGDFLLAKALQLSVRGGRSVMEMISTAIARACRGRVAELRHAFDVELTEAECLDIIAMKTATLFELPCKLGAHLAHTDPRYTRALTRYGHHLGIAFQLTDDVLDISGHAATLGKPTGTDLREGVYALPVLTALRQAPGGQLAAILGQANPGPGDIDHAIALIRETDALSRARRLAAQHAQRAASAVTALPPTPTRTSLLALTDYAINRNVIARPSLAQLIE